MNESAAKAYRSTSFEAAPPLKIIRMLYAGALRCLDQGAACDPLTEGPRFNEHLGKADAIVSELRCALEPVHAPELVAELDRLYDFVGSCINEAVAQRATAPLEGARRVMGVLKSAWDDLEVASDEPRRVA